MSIAEDSYVHPTSTMQRSSAVESSGEIVLTIATSALNEAPSVPLFLDRAVAALETLGVSGEILFVDDGSTDGTADAVEAFAREHFQTPIRLVRHGRPRGLAAAINECAEQARGTFVCFVPADLECDPGEDVPKLYRAASEDVDVVVGQRVGRGDKKQFASSVYNRLNSWLFGVSFRDGNWIKLVRRERLVGIRLRNDWHPFLTPILARAGCRFATVDTAWLPRKHGRSKFGMRRFPKAMAAALSVKFHLRFGARPFLFFLAAALGFGALSAVLLAAAWLVDAGSVRTWTLLQIASAATFVAGWTSILAGLVIEVLAHGDSSRSEK